MRSKTLSLPHPVIGNGSDDIDANFEACIVNILTHSNADTYKLDINLNCSSEDVQKLVVQKKANYVVRIQCNKAFFRQIFKSFNPAYDITLTASDLKGKVELDFFISMCKDVNDFEFTEAHSDYEGQKFDLNTGDIIAQAETQEFFAERKLDETEKLGSLIRFDVDPTGKRSSVWYEYGDSKITVYLPKTQHEQLNEVYIKQRHLTPILISSLATPALIQALQILRKAEEDKDDIGLRWAELIEERREEICAKHKNIEYDADAEIANLIVKDTVGQSMGLLAAIASGERE
jgi:hypothetical protein